MIGRTTTVLLSAIALVTPTIAVAQDFDPLIPPPPWHTYEYCYQAALHWARMHAQEGTPEYYNEFYDYFYANCDNID